MRYSHERVTHYLCGLLCLSVVPYSLLVLGQIYLINTVDRDQSAVLLSPFANNFKNGEQEAKLCLRASAHVRITELKSDIACTYSDQSLHPALCGYPRIQ